MSHYTGSVPNTLPAAPTWHAQARCARPEFTDHEDLWFARTTDHDAIEAAKRECRACPVIQACGEYALTERIEHGVWGGMTNAQRRNLLRSMTRRKLTPEAVAKKADKARQPTKQRTLRAIVDDSTTRLDDGHREWTGKTQVHFRGQIYTPKQACFIVDRGHFPKGRVTSVCGNYACVLPEHLTDQEERGWCSTRSTKAAA